MNVLKTLSLVALAGLSGLGYAAAQEPQRVIAHPGVNNARPADARSLKWKVAVGRFSNETQYGKGIFYERDNDPMAKQALDILMTKLNASGKFILLERSDSEKLEAELKAGQGQRIGADYLILGSITEFGRKTTGRDGLFTSEKSQTVEAGVSIRIVDVATGQVIYSEEGKGQAQTTSKSTLGLGGRLAMMLPSAIRPSRGLSISSSRTSSISAPTSLGVPTSSMPMPMVSSSQAELLRAFVLEIPSRSTSVASR